MALLFAVRLTAAAFAYDFSPFTYLGHLAGEGARSVLLAGAVVALALLIWLVIRHRPDMLWLADSVAPGPAPHAAVGGVLVPAASLERSLGAAAGDSHPDVVRVEVSLRVRRGALRGRARVFARPLADAGAVARAVDAGLRAAACRLTGRELEALRVDVRVLRTGQLKRHLP